MTALDIRSYRESDQEAVVQLWRDCDLLVPSNDPIRDIQRKLRLQGDMLLVRLLNNCPVATVMAGYEGHRGWINYLATAPDCQGNGYG
jgi:hypothetical protein